MDTEWAYHSSETRRLQILLWSPDLQLGWIHVIANTGFWLFFSFILYLICDIWTE